MAISLNALLNVPTREEKSRKQLAEKAAIDRIAEMQLADELARGRAEFASRLGLDTDDEAYRRLVQREVENMKTAGDPTPETTTARGRMAGVREAANKFVQEQTGGLLGLPQRRAEADRARADVDAIAGANEAEYQLARGGVSGLLGQKSALSDVAKMNLDIDAAEMGRSNLPLRSEAERAGYRSDIATADELSASAPLRKLQNELGLATAQNRLGFLSQIAEDPVWNAIVNSGINPQVLGYGVNPAFMGERPLPLPGDKNPQPPQRGTGLLQSGGKKSQSDILREILQNLPLVD